MAKITKEERKIIKQEGSIEFIKNKLDNRTPIKPNPNVE